MGKVSIPGRGRPPKPGLDEAILVAALEELARVGYTRMRVEDVARRAGATKPTVYARFSSKAELATAALSSLRGRTPRSPTGDVRADLIEELTLFRAGALRPYGMSMLGAVLAEEHETPDLLELFRANVVAPRRANLRRILRSGRDTGQLRSDVDIETGITMLVGSLYATYVAGRAVGPDWPRRVVDAWLDANGPDHSRAVQ
jgi:AcrR family transcriptional regulator